MFFQVAETVGGNATGEARKGENYVVDILRSPDSAVVVGGCYRLYDGGFDPYFARNCHYNRACTDHSRAEGFVECEVTCFT